MSIYAASTGGAGITVLQMLGGVGAVFGIIAAVVAVALFVRGSYAKARIEALRDDLEDERKAAESLRNRVDDLEKENERINLKIEGLERENAVLRNQPSLDLGKVILAINELKGDWLVKLDGLARIINTRFDRLEGGKQ